MSRGAAGGQYLRWLQRCRTDKDPPIVEFFAGSGQVLGGYLQKKLASQRTTNTHLGKEFQALWLFRVLTRMDKVLLGMTDLKTVRSACIK